MAVQIYVHPDGQRLRILIRAPLESMRDVIWPLRGPGYLDIARLGSHPADAARLWIASYLTLYEDGRQLPRASVAAARISLPSDRAFVAYDSALAHITGQPLPPETEIVWNQAWLDALLEVPIADPASRFSIDPELAHLGVETLSVLHFVAVDGTERVSEVHRTWC